jgi:predicted negative regulator of RcsB-dependent stress response
VIVAYTTFLERWPENLVASIALANKHYEQGAFDAAEAVLRQAAVHHPDSVVVLNNLAQTVSDQGRSDEALAIIERTDGVESPFAEVVGETRAMILRRLATTR